MADGMVKLGDLGVAGILDSDLSFASTYAGTNQYMSPEMWIKEKYNQKVSSEIYIMWSLK